MAIENYRMATLGAFVGKELGVSEWVEVDQARIDAFAQCTNDSQWIHVDVERASKES
ncbi:nodulation protein NodN, partial [Pseudomonas sp. GW460-13]